jgi:poly-gamma-glutamate biosynthesis protein PgsC/CapC
MPFETVFIGVVAALIYTEITGLQPGGIIVPAFLTLTVDHPWRALATVGIACLSLLCYRAFARYFILFGKRRFVLMLLLGAFWVQVWHLLAPALFFDSPELRAVGLIIPGLLANNLERQKILPTLASLATVVAATYFLVQLVRLFA